MLQYHPSNPFRECDWRWQYARTLREKKVRTKSSEDPWVKTAFEFQAGLAKCTDDVDRYDLMESFPDLYGAYLIFNRGEDEERHPIRYALEARILAEQPIVDIAARLGVGPGTVEAYERIFFNVTEKLKNSDYIMTCVIGPAVHAGLSDRDYDLLWKLFGYIYGPVVLDAFIHTTTNNYRPESLSEINATLAEDARASLQRKVAIVARTYTVNPFSQSELLNLYARLLEMEKETGGQKNRDVILQNVQVMLDKLPFRAGEENIEQPLLLDKYDNSNAELRTDELMAAASGKDTSLHDEFRSLKFPEPKPNVKQIK